MIKSFPELKRQYSSMRCVRQQRERQTTEAVCSNPFLFSIKSLTNGVSIGNFSTGKRSATVKAVAAHSAVHALF